MPIRNLFPPFAGPVLILILTAVASSAGDVNLIGRSQFAATANDLSGNVDPQENGTPQNRLGGLGSAIAWTGRGQRYVMLPDRGPDDGATSYRCRFHEVEITVDCQSVPPVSARLIRTVYLKTRDGQNFLGRASQFDREHPERTLRLDPEGVRVTSAGTILISDEYGPTVREFNLEGEWLRDLATPVRYQIRSPGATPEEELPPVNQSGRQTNRGWEGLALSRDSRYVYAITQSPLIQDGGLDETNKRVGTNIRILESELASGKTREFLYPLDEKSLGISEIEAIGDQRLFVIERDSLAGDAAKVKRIYEIDLTQATDISQIEQLPATEIPAGVQPVRKSLLLDLLHPDFGLAGTQFPEKIEGIAEGPRLPDGSMLLLVTSDNDFKADQPTEIYAFSIK